MTTKLNQLLDELTMLKEYFAQDLLVNGLTEMVVLKDDLEELIAKYTETTPTYKPGDKVRIVNTCLKAFIGTKGILIRNTSEKIWSIDHALGLVYFEEEEFEPVNKNI